MVLVDNYLPLTSLTFHIAVVCACTLDNDLCVSCFAEVVTGGRCGSASCVAHFASSDDLSQHCLLYTSPSPRDATLSRMPSSA